VTVAVAALPAARAVRDSDSIAGVAPPVVYAPRDLAQAQELMTHAARAGLKLGFLGGGTQRALGAPPRGIDAAISTDRWR